MSSIKQTLLQASEILAKTSTSARLDAEILLVFVLKQTRTYLYTHPEQLLNTQQIKLFKQLIAKRGQGVPIAYLTNMREFWSLPLFVNEHTLIPRAETELLVELTLEHLSSISQANILDLGTGCGAIALALATEQPNWQITASDYSLLALNVVAENIRKFKIHNIKIQHSNWFDSLDKVSTPLFNAIISNPPYIAEQDQHLHQGDLRFEPQTALTSGSDGLHALRHIINTAAQYLLPGGLLLLEHGYNQQTAVQDLLKHADYQNIKSWSDYNRQDRISGGWREN